MSLDKHQARKYFNIFFQNNPQGVTLEDNKRVALCNPAGNYLFGISGGGAAYEKKLRKETREAFYAMLTKHGVEKREVHIPINCAEAHLWIKLVEMGQSPRKLDVYVAKKQRAKKRAGTKKRRGKPRAKKDSPCKNCQQWVREEFRSINQI